jgi:hypothetical protein
MGGSGLHPRRAVAYRRLIRVLGRTCERRYGWRGSAAATRDFARWYGTCDATVRAHVDAVLDAVVIGAPLTPRRLQRPASPTAAAQLAAALNLAAVACEPPPDEDERPAVPTLDAAA